MTEKVEREANDTVISEILEMNPELEGIGNYEYGWADSDVAGQAAKRGLDEAVVRDISMKKNEPEWMLNMRLKALKFFERKPMPTWGADLSEIDFDNIKYFVRSTEGQAESWEELPEDIRITYERLGIPEAERNSLVAGVAAQYESEVVYHQIREDLEAQGVIFVDTDTGLRDYPELFKEYFGSIIPIGDNKFSALNTAVWSGGSFVYVPPGCTWKSRCRRISVLILRTWASLSAPSLSRMRGPMCITLRAVPPPSTSLTRCTRRSLRLW